MLNEGALVQKDHVTSVNARREDYTNKVREKFNNLEELLSFYF